MTLGFSSSPEPSVDAVFSIGRSAKVCTTVGVVVVELLISFGSVAAPAGVAVAVAVRFVPAGTEGLTVPSTSANAAGLPDVCTAKDETWQVTDEVADPGTKGPQFAESVGGSVSEGLAM